MAQDLQVGERLPDVVVQPTALQLFRYSAVTWNAHRVHFDRDWADHEGHAGLLVHSHLHAANAIRAITEGLGADWQITRVGYRIVRSASLGDTLTASAEVKERSVGGDELTFELRETNGNGEACLEGTAVVRRRS